MDEQIRLIGDSFLQMEQKIAAQQQRISNLEDRNIEFKKLLQLLIKEEGTCMSTVPTVASAYLLGVFVCILCVCL